MHDDDNLVCQTMAAYDKLASEVFADVIQDADDRRTALANWIGTGVIPADVEAYCREMLRARSAVRDLFHEDELPHAHSDECHEACLCAQLA